MCAYGTIYKSVGVADTEFILYSFLFIISSRQRQTPIYLYLSTALFKNILISSRKAAGFKISTSSAYCTAQ